ncbi:hypothetical protein [Paraburkholderia sp. 35.1]|uniref:hypothetical protein n=1 Tax=Paraburkholderia sp. 35.1 TaxID=2991058 RepID=UPI003D23EA94
MRLRVGRTRSPFPEADVRLHLIANDSKAMHGSRTAAERRASAMADEATSIPASQWLLAAAQQSPECPNFVASECHFMAELSRVAPRITHASSDENDFVSLTESKGPSSSLL